MAIDGYGADHVEAFKERLSKAGPEIGEGRNVIFDYGMKQISCIYLSHSPSFIITD